MVIGFGVTSVGMFLLANVGVRADYVTDILPGMLVGGLGLGIVLVSVSVAVMTGARDDEVGMLSGLNTTGHEIGGSLGVAALVTIATGAMRTSSPAGLADGIGQAFTVAAGASVVAAALAMLVVPTAAVFLPKFRSSPRLSVH